MAVRFGSNQASFWGVPLLTGLAALCLVTATHCYAQPTGPGFTLKYNGANQFVSTGSQLIPGGDFTVECWALLSGGTGPQIILSDGLTNDAVYLGKDSSGNIRLGEGWRTTAILLPNNGAWHHLALVRSGSDALFYLDGLLRTNRGAAIPTPSGGELRFGRQYGTNTEYWNGQIDEVRIWNLARNAADITNNMNRPLTGNESGLHSYWRFDEGHGGTTHDELGSGAAVQSSGWTASTVPFVPGVTASSPLNIRAASATLTGNIYVNASSAAAFFQWGINTDYGNQTPLTNKTSDQAVSSQLLNLLPETLYHFRLAGSNSAGVNFSSDQTLTTLSANSALANLSCSAGTLSPAFSSAITNYALSQPLFYTIANATITPASASASASIQVRINGGGFSTVTSGAASGSLALNVGSNIIDLLVTAQDPAFTQIYSLTLVRAAPISPTVMTLAADLITSTNARLNGLVNPNGTTAGAYFDWGLTTNYGQSTVPISQGNGTQSQAATGSITNLAPSTLYHFRVAATNSAGLSLGGDQTFTSLGTNAELLSLTSSGGALVPAFNPHIFHYSQSIAAGSLVILTPTAVDSNATLQLGVNGGGWNTIVSGNPTAPVSINLGLNTVVIQVTAQDGVAARTYTNSIYVFNVSPGSLLWSAPVGSGLPGKPINDVGIKHHGIRGPQVFVLNGRNLYAVDNATGAGNWSFTANASLNQPIVTRLSSGSEALFVTASDGLVSGINADTGAALWNAVNTKRKSGTGTTLCANDGISSPPSVQLYDESNPAFRSAFLDDLVIVGTHYDPNCNSGYLANRVYGLKASTGAIAWTFNLFGQQVDFLGPGTVDSEHNILYVGSNQPNGRGQPTLWQISTMDGSLLASQNYGAIRNKPILAGDRLYVATYNGTLLALSTNLLTLIWSFPVATNANVSSDPVVARPCGDGQNIVLVVDSSGRLHAIRDLGTNGQVAWPSSGSAVTVGAPIVSPALGKAFFSALMGNEGWVYQMDLGFGGIEAGFDFGPYPLAEPTFDSSGNLLVDSITVAQYGPPGGLTRLRIPWETAVYASPTDLISTSDKVRIIKSASTKTAIAGQPITYSLLVTNLDETAFMTGVFVTDYLPAGMSNAVLTSSQGTVATVPAPACLELISSRSDSSLDEVSTSGYQVRANLGILTNRTSASITITLTPSQVGYLTNTAYAVANQTVLNFTNCASTVVVQVLDPAADDDGDGVLNLQEYLAGTDPLNPNSYFRVKSINRQTNDVTVTWTTVGGRQYELQAAASLGTNFAPVSPVFTIPGAGDATTNFVETGVGTLPARQYRVRVVP